MLRSRERENMNINYIIGLVGAVAVCIFGMVTSVKLGATPPITSSVSDAPSLLHAVIATHMTNIATASTTLSNLFTFLMEVTFFIKKFICT